MAIVKELQREQPEKPPAYELGKHLFGRHGSGRHDLSCSRKAVLGKTLDAKHHHRRRTVDRPIRPT